MVFELCCEAALLLRIFDDYTVEVRMRNNNLPTKMLSTLFSTQFYSGFLKITRPIPLGRRSSTCPDNDHFSKWNCPEQLQYPGYTEAIRRY